MPQYLTLQQATQVSRDQFIAALCATVSGQAGQGVDQWISLFAGQPRLVHAALMLQDTRDLLATPERWCRFTHGVNHAGGAAPYHDPGCVQRCLDGALQYAKQAVGRRIGGDAPVTCQLADCTVSWLAGGSVPGWNDDPNRTHAEVTELLTQGIAILRDAAACMEK